MHCSACARANWKRAVPTCPLPASLAVWRMWTR
ncbi:MAG: hypothetical protein IPK99_01695 [Flavobacteriales bacterium]|nr:hypothetical protein [Flavobacteriales bacterium]